MPDRFGHLDYEFITLLAAGAVTGMSNWLTGYLNNYIGVLISLATLGLLLSKIYLNIKKGRKISGTICTIEDCDEKNKDTENK